MNAVSAFVDRLASRLYGRTAIEAQRLAECIKCHRDMRSVALSSVDEAEYGITALCPDCWASIFPDGDES